MNFQRNGGVAPVEENDLLYLAHLHARDIIALLAVLMKAKPITTLVVPLEDMEWFKHFCDRHGLVRFEDGPADSYQASMGVCQDDTVELWKELKETATLLDKLDRNAIIMSRVRDDLRRLLSSQEGVMFGYPECCVKFHVEKGPSSRARAYEEFLESKKDRAVPIEFWAVAHAPCSSTCQETLKLGRKYLTALAEFSDVLQSHVEGKLLLPRFYQTGGGRFIDLKPLDNCKERLAVSKEQFEEDANQRLPMPVEIVLCEVTRPCVLVAAPEEPPYKTPFPNPDIVGTMWLAYSPGFGAYMVNAKTGKLALYISSDEWIPKVGEEWRSKSNFRIYSSVKGSLAQPRV
jgi:hypothetical protein